MVGGGGRFSIPYEEEEEMKYSDSSASLHFPLCPLGGAIHFLPSPPSPFVARYRHAPHVSRLHGQGREQVRKKAPFIWLKMYNKRNQKS